MNRYSTPRRTTRAPNGASTSLHITLTQAERARVDALAAREHRSVGSTARLLVLRGLDDLERNGQASLAS